MPSLAIRRSVAAAFALVGLISTATQPAMANSWYTYYEDYFSTSGTCASRGDYMVANINGIRDYGCYRASGDTKWSMDVYDIFAR